MCALDPFRMTNYVLISHAYFADYADSNFKVIICKNPCNLCEIIQYIFLNLSLDFSKT